MIRPALIHLQQLHAAASSHIFFLRITGLVLSNRQLVKIPAPWKAVRATKSVIDAATKEDYAYIVTDELSGDQVS